MQLTGIHHVTAVSARIADNMDFYTAVLGLRLVKRSVNQDDVSAYHLFYADKLGSPGTDMTFFDWPRIGADLRGTDSIAGTAFRVSSREALEFWAERFDKLSVKRGQISAFAERDLLPFEDPEGQQLYLVNDRGADFEGEIWPHPEIPDEYALRGFYSVVLLVPERTQLSWIFKEILGFSEVLQANWTDGTTPAAIFSTNSAGGPGREVWLLEDPESPRARLGAGGTHHVAFRVGDVEKQIDWLERLQKAGLNVSPQIDRFWFKSIYFRVTPGILFEIATDGPGFAIDEHPESLGENLVLPPFLEGRRQEIEAGLVPLPGG
ncbi:MAG: ring-cleaving dioxygenase [Anaerolineales bacterium]|jgi:glyoxalase family protein